ncbi:MAG: hypothetical protein JSU95_08940 [Betaproteobacteria bacterium]|nr:MAG: hypothetical protein JSU95_08940 [Betaproteobacteria bacterium]
MRRFVAIVALLITANAPAHDLITAELAEGYLNKAVKWHEQSETDTDTAERAKAYLRIGVMLDEIRGYLNRDLAVHGEVQGLASTYLVAELKRVGTPLAYSASRNYFTANSDYYRMALELGLNSILAREARLRLLRGEFYDSFDVDPLETSQSPEQLAQSVALVEQLLATVSSEPDLEEVRFIAAIVYARAAQAATDAAARAEYRGKALAYVDAFIGDYPDSLRSAAMPVVRAALYDLN